MTQNLPVPVDGIQQYFKEISKFPILSRDEEQQLARRFRDHQDREAAQQLVLSNLRFVVKIANEYRNYGFKLADLIQEGNMGLLTAVKKFDPDKNYRLISYAVWWIRAFIQNYVIRSWSLVRIGTTTAQRKLFYKLKETKQKLIGDGTSESYDIDLTDEKSHEIAERLALKEEDVIAMNQRMTVRDLSLNATIGDNDKTTHLDLLASPANQEETVADNEEAAQLSVEVEGALAQLKPREEYIVRHRLMADEPMTLQAIGDHYGISRERARQLEARAKKKLRERLASHEGQAA